MTLKELLNIQTEKYGDKTFLYWEDLEVSYKELEQIAENIAGNLIDRGIEKDDKVCVLLANRPEYIYLLFGSALAGAVAVPVNVQFKADEVKYIVQNSDAKILITSAEFIEAVESIRGDCPGLKQVILLDEQRETAVPFEKLMEKPAKPAQREILDDDIAGIIYTSGTTGYPKGVLLSHKNYVVNASQIVAATQMTEDDRFMCILPLFHVNAQLVTTFAPFFAGGSMILLKGFSPKEFLPKLSRYKATAFSGVPTVYAILNNLPDAEQYDLSHLRFCICGAAPMPVEVFETFERKYKAFILEGYGLSEGTCASSINPLGGKRKIGSIGLPLPGQCMKIVDDEGRDLLQGSIGEIIVQGENLMQGYYKNDEASSQTLKQGWLHTGDLGYIDEEGYFFIVGRKKEMIIRGGENIYPKEIEEVLYKHPSIREAAVVGIPDKIWGEEVVAFVVLKDDGELLEKEFYDYCYQHLANYKCPRRLEICKDLPKTATGKIQKPKIVETYAKKE